MLFIGKPKGRSRMISNDYIISLFKSNNKSNLHPGELSVETYKEKNFGQQAILMSCFLGPTQERERERKVYHKTGTHWGKT